MESDWSSLRDIRLGALRSDPGVFLSTYEAERTKADEEWRVLAGGDERQQLFGLFDDEMLAGITAVFTDRRDPLEETALFAMSYIAPEYRGRGLSRLFYETRLDWVRAQGRFMRVRVSHRRSNEVSRRANQHFGFQQTGIHPTEWPDGTSEDEIRYELLVDPAAK